MGSPGLYFPRHNVNPDKNPDAFRLATSRLVGLLDHVKDTEYFDRGKRWYGEQSRMAFRDSRDAGISKTQGTGILSIVSPGMDYDQSNVHAIGQIHNLSEQLTKNDWKVIEHSATQQNRTDEAREIVSRHAPSISQANDLAIITARDLFLTPGSSLEDFVDPVTNPKRIAFDDNLLHPQSSKKVTIDGRMHDMIANRMVPWDYSNRGINRAYNPVRKTQTRYQDFENVVRASTSAAAALNPRAFGGLRPHEAQAVYWIAGKHMIERENDTRRQGPDRVGQPYF